MFDTTTKSVWYGRLNTSSSSTPVIYDPGLPPPPTGQIYLYNAERNAILKYAATVVEPLLHGLEKGEHKMIEKALGKKWRSVRKTFLRDHARPLPSKGKQKEIKPAGDELMIDDQTDDDWTEIDLDDI